MTDSSPLPPPPLPPQYRVSIWEGVAIATGAIALTLVGLVGLGVKALDNAFDPNRAEAIAHSMVEYEIPGGAQGRFGANLGGLKVAVIAGAQLPPGITPVADAIAALPSQAELFIAHIPAEEKGVPNTEANIENDLFFSGFSFSYQTESAFQVQTVRQEVRSFCGVPVSVSMQIGTLTFPDGKTLLPAVRYEAELTQASETRLAIVSTVGQEAMPKAEQVFNSLRCKV